MSKRKPRISGGVTGPFSRNGSANEAVSAADQLGDFFPVDFAGVEAEGDPTAGSHVSREVEAIGLGGGQRLILTGEDLAGYRDNAVAVMVVEEVGEGLFADQELRMATLKLARDLGQGKAELREADQAAIFGGLGGHYFNAPAT